VDSTRRRHLISLRDVRRDYLDYLVDRGVVYALVIPAGQSLRDRVVGMYFGLTSTRTRTAFTTAAIKLGGHAISYGPHDLQVSTGECMSDTGKVLACMLDALVVRIPGGEDDLMVLAEQDSMSVINAMSHAEHPTQALADLTTMRRRFGRIDGLRVLYLGEGNSTAVALCLALARYHDVELHVRSPAGYGLPDEALRAAEGTATGTRIEERHDMLKLPECVDVVYTTRWETTGTSKRDTNWRDIFQPFRVEKSILDRNPSAVFMHDLPAHRGEEVESAVIDGPASVVFDQAANKLYSAMAALEWCVVGSTGIAMTSETSDPSLG
jgi:ornithine carbamoyltransferase